MAERNDYDTCDWKKFRPVIDHHENTRIISLEPIGKIICVFLALLLVSCHKHNDFIPPPPAPQFNYLDSGYIANSIVRSQDGGYVVAGFTRDFGTHGSIDAWVAKLDKQGTKLWQKTIGGSSTEVAEFITTTLDGGYITSGFSYSKDGDVSGNHGIGDAWVVKLDREGNISWQQSLGGSSADEAHAVAATSDSGYIIACETLSVNGDVSGNHGSLDGWVVKLDKDGNRLWQKALGGSDWDAFYSVAQSSDGGYLAAGYTRSNNGDVSGYHGVNDGWVVKLDQDGNKLWQKTLGGTNADGINSLIVTADGGCITAGVTKSNDGDVSGNHGEGDAWIIKLSKDGNIVWQKALGGSNWETAYVVAPATGDGYVIAATTRSNNGDVSGFHGGQYDDAWIMKLDREGNKLWQKALGGSAQDDAKSVITTVNGDYVIAGNTNSNDGDVSESHGGMHAWVFTLKDQ